VKKWLEITPETETTYEMSDLLFHWINKQLNTHNLVLGTRLSVSKLYDILPPELQAMISVTTECNPRRYNGHKITVCHIDEFTEAI
jgi:hypothetical protein